jgi:tetratricopeptide (TPR) repeat protein
MESFDKVISLRPDNYHYYLRKGNVLRMLGRNDEAIVLYNDAFPSFDEAISKAEDPKELLIEKSRLLKEAGRLHESVECLEKVIALDPEDISSLGHLADTYLLLRDHDKVIELSDVVISRGVFLDSSYGNKGEALEAMGNLDDAMECYTKSIESNNDYLLGHMGKGSVSANRGKTEKLWNVGTNFSESIKLIQTKGLT